ncbi:hypothetical protein ACTHPF_10960 [Paenibacillus sp. SAF-054]
MQRSIGPDPGISSRSGPPVYEITDRKQEMRRLPTYDRVPKIHRELIP